jgi:hypothetical protein
MSSAKGGGAAKGGSGSGKGGGEVVPMPGGPIDGGQVVDLPTPPPEPPPEPYNAQRDFYGDGNMVNQPLPGYFQTYPAPGGNNYAPPVVEEPVDPAYGTQPTDPDPVLGGSNSPANTSPEVRAAYAAGAAPEASASMLAAFNMGVEDTNRDGLISDEEFAGWGGYDNWLAKNPNHQRGDDAPGSQPGSRFTGQYGADGKPIYTSAVMGAPSGNTGDIDPEMLAWLGSNVYNQGGYGRGGGVGGQTYNPDFLPNNPNGVFGGTILNPSIYR